ncbi:MAG: aminopeptidase [Desulfobacteraceae bacterium]|nr:MAG: aminopeptidase [Desulfobacteraceae bacterium]
MLTSTQIQKYAEVLLWGIKAARKKTFKKNEIVLLRFDPPGLSLAEAVHGLLLEHGFNPVVRPGGSSVMEHNFYARAGKAQLAFVAPGEKELMEKVNASIYIHAPESLTHLSDIDPKKIGTALLARKFLRDITQKREAEGSYSWTLCLYPTIELSRKAGMTIKAYANQVVKACYLDREDPVKEWNTIYREVAAIKEWLNSMHAISYRIESDKIDLVIRPGERRKWVGVSGHNIPSFEIFMSPDWRGTEGRYYADQPSYRSGNLVEGVRLTFKKGSVVESGAERGEDFLKKQLAMDKGACKVGEFSLTDRRFSRISRFMANTLYDENFGGLFGNCHLAVGSSYADSYDGDTEELTKDMKKELGFNDSALHWDLVNTEKKTVTANMPDGSKRVIYENGMFKC